MKDSKDKNKLTNMYIVALSLPAHIIVTYLEVAQTLPLIH